MGSITLNRAPLQHATTGIVLARSVDCSNQSIFITIMNPSAWPYPFWIAHRGAGHAAPENTLAAFRRGLRSAFRMFECDVQLSQDHALILLHDNTLDRTTNGHGPAGNQPWNALRCLDAGSWHSAPYAGEPIATLAQISQFCQTNDCQLNIELKPSPGHETLTGELTAKAVESLWRNAPNYPLLTSFSAQSLVAAHQAAPSLTRGLLIEEIHSDWQRIMQQAACQALVCHHAIITADLIKKTHAHGWYCLAYTVNDLQRANDLISLGIDGLITDQLNLPKRAQSLHRVNHAKKTD